MLRHITWPSFAMTFASSPVCHSYGFARVRGFLDEQSKIVIKTSGNIFSQQIILKLLTTSSKHLLPYLFPSEPHTIGPRRWQRESRTALHLKQERLGTWEGGWVVVVETF